MLGCRPGITSYIGWPDETVGWVPAAIWHALQSSPPASAGRAVQHYRRRSLRIWWALIVSRATGIPWVADFRDAWIRNPEADRLIAPVSEELSARLERAIVRPCASTFVPDESVELLDIGPESNPRLVLIRNGVDPDDISAVDPHHARRAVSDLLRRRALRGPQRRTGVRGLAEASSMGGRRSSGRLGEIRIVGSVGSAWLDGNRNLERLPLSR